MEMFINIRLGWKWLTAANTLAYHTIFTVKKFYSAGPENSHNGLRKYLKKKVFLSTLQQYLK
jgi:hypothetical protein